jgi:hypothetical protein
MAANSIPPGTVVSVPQWDHDSRTARINVRVHSTYIGGDGRGGRMDYIRAVYPARQGTLHLTTFAAEVADAPTGDGTVAPHAEAETARILARKEPAA